MSHDVVVAGRGLGRFVMGAFHQPQAHADVSTALRQRRTAVSSEPGTVWRLGGSLPRIFRRPPQNFLGLSEIAHIMTVSGFRRT
jgi:hypothetical protein